MHNSPTAPMGAQSSSLPFRPRAQNLPLSGLDAFVKACKFFGQDVKVEGVNWNNLMDTIVGLGGAGKGESGPGWSAPPPAQVPVPDPVPRPGGFGWSKPAIYGPATAGEPYPKQK